MCSRQAGEPMCRAPCRTRSVAAHRGPARVGRSQTHRAGTRRFRPHRNPTRTSACARETRGQPRLRGRRAPARTAPGQGPRPPQSRWDQRAHDQNRHPRNRRHRRQNRAPRHLPPLRNRHRAHLTARTHAQAAARTHRRTRPRAALGCAQAWRNASRDTERGAPRRAPCNPRRYRESSFQRETHCRRARRAQRSRRP